MEDVGSWSGSDGGEEEEEEEEEEEFQIALLRGGGGEAELMFRSWFDDCRLLQIISHKLSCLFTICIFLHLYEMLLLMFRLV